MDPDPANLIIKLAVLLLLILVNAFFAMSEIAVITLNDGKLRKMAEEGHKKAQKILKLTSNSSSFLSTIQIGVTLAGFLTSASAAENFSDPLAKAMAGWFGRGAVLPQHGFPHPGDHHHLLLLPRARRAGSQTNRHAEGRGGLL